MQKDFYSKTYGKLALDLILLTLLALMYQKRVISMGFHEIGGLVLIGLFLLHKALNWKWIRSVASGLLQRRISMNALWLYQADDALPLFSSGTQRDAIPHKPSCTHSPASVRRDSEKLSDGRKNALPVIDRNLSFVLK